MKSVVWIVNLFLVVLSFVFAGLGSFYIMLWSVKQDGLILSSVVVATAFIVALLFYLERVRVKRLENRNFMWRFSGDLKDPG